jgi:L-fucose isomerase-like protein
MWDWELITYLKSEGAGGRIIAPYHLELTRVVLRALAVKRLLRTSKFVVYQDNPGDGMQAPIFKRFYWWESECAQRMMKKFGLTIEKRSFKKLGADAKKIPDAEAETAAQAHPVPHALPEKSLKAAMKLYLAVKRDIGDDPAVQGVGINCLNESAFSDCTPCLAWNLLYQERGLIWGCEADIMAMLTKLILHRSLGAPVIMTNLYPFLMGQAALKHERIPAFPKVDGNPRDYILAAHCGYLGVVPQSFSTQWTLRKKVLAIVDENASAIDARLPEGPLTLAKLHPDMTTMTVVEGELTGYAGYPDSDCLNGAVIRVPNGHRLMTELASHHYLLVTGHHLAAIEPMGTVFGLAPKAV